MHLSSQKYYFDWFEDLVGLIFPKTCVHCGLELNKRENSLCISCEYKLPRSNYHRIPDNPVADKFRGRLPIKSGFSFLRFTQGNMAQTLMHELKYRQREDLGERLGKLFGSVLLIDDQPAPDLIIPLPLHESKKRKRGYNQCDSIVQGMSEVIKTPFQTDVVKRVVANPSQTRKSRFDRWENVERIFEVSKPECVLGRHVMLVDDVVTTGSTLESCGRALLEAGAKELTIATLASA